MFSYIKTAFQSIWHHKIRSLLTLLGVVIGVSSVTILISLGQGLKNDVSGLIQSFGTNVIIVVAGNVEASSNSVNPANFISGDILTVEDVIAIQGLSDIEAVTPISLVPGNIKYQDKTSSPVIYGVYPNFLDAFEVLTLGSGRIFSTQNEGNVIVLGPSVKDNLFNGEEKLDEKVFVNDVEFNVIGYLGDDQSSSIFGSEFDTSAIIPFDQATQFNKNETKIMRIIIKATDSADVGVVKTAINDSMKGRHEADEFSVLTQDDILGLFNEFLDLSTALVSAIAAISLIVGGIGIMNIMLVTVTERTKEIGLRKAVGATKFAILVQFLTESIVITMLGGLIGLGISLIVGAVVASQTPLTPEITPQVVFIAVGVSTLIGIMFGLWPAINAANKDPIEALRYE